MHLSGQENLICLGGGKGITPQPGKKKGRGFLRNERGKERERERERCRYFLGKKEKKVGKVRRVRAGRDISTFFCSIFFLLVLRQNSPNYHHHQKNYYYYNFFPLFFFWGGRALLLQL